MKILTADEFRKLTDADPAYALTLTEPTFITGYCDMQDSKITHLSHFLQFCGDIDPDKLHENADVEQCVAKFDFCEHLTTLRGTFHGHVSFLQATFKEIDPDPETGLVITRTNHNGDAAKFDFCKTDVAQGNYPGFVSYYGSTIKRMGVMNVTQPNSSGEAASFHACTELEEARGKFNGRVELDSTGITKATRELEILQPNHAGEAISMANTSKLVSVDLKLPGNADLWNSNVQEVHLEIEGCNEEKESANLSQCAYLKKLTGEFSHSIDLNQTGIEHIDNRQLKIRTPDKDGVFCGAFCCALFEKNPINAGMIIYGLKNPQELEKKIEEVRFQDAKSTYHDKIWDALQKRKVALKTMKAATLGTGMEM